MKKKLIAQNDDLIEQGQAKKLIRISDDGKRIEYLRHGISRDWTKPEASVEAKAYLTLVLQYGYPDDRIRLFAPVTIGSSLREADIEVYADAKHETPIIIVECKKEEVSEAEFRQAVEQAFSYAVSEGAKYVWTTSGIKNEYYEVPDKKPKARKTGAGVKSSVLFLRKRTKRETEKLRTGKESLQRKIAEKGKLVERLAEIDKIRKAELAKLDKRAEFAALKPKERKEVPEYKTAADQIAAVAEKATAELRDKLDSEYKSAVEDAWPEENIFMAIAEDIGFDATGKPTKVNELDEIGVALAKFIKDEKGEGL